MDTFNKLPAELRQEILIQTFSRRTISQLIHASPTMLQQYIASKEYITRALLASEFDDSMVQDAMAIILFPPHPTYGDLTTEAFHHCQSWAAQELQNPLLQPLTKQNGPLINKLGELHGQLLFFVEDYLTKATAVLPCREYICLSELSIIRNQLTFKGRPVSNRFDAANLTGLERKRLLRAFLRYQLRCLIFQGRGRFVDKYFDKALHQYGDQKFQPSDQEAIRCVHTYVKSIYGAIFAQCSDAWLPEVDSVPTSSAISGLLYPDSFWVDPDAYASDMCWRSYIPDASKLASLGFDPVKTFLRSAAAGEHGRDHLKKWFVDDCVRRHKKGDPYWWISDRSLMGYNSGHEGEEDCQKSPGMYQRLHLRIAATCETHREIYRQRAWVFFDDSRFYPSSGVKQHFPTSDDLKKERFDVALRNAEWVLNPADARARHRSQKWHDGKRKVIWTSLDY
ncbi:hypothetical protein CDEST_13169 [Colletotrichum destructivum]|uniref:F-box domain-containing protein n=1 Tax=Colletotrichum destructivum TaxID=34406 RepID=A0AAX4IY40_9PEZI|nr:hypothetical protein CDEST_13169 [Colletotrichum destructivum]